jgi:hypothetical protein
MFERLFECYLKGVSWPNIIVKYEVPWTFNIEWVVLIISMYFILMYINCISKNFNGILMVLQCIWIYFIVF